MPLLHCRHSLSLRSLTCPSLARDAHRPVDSEGKAKKIKVGRNVCLLTMS